MWSRSTKQRRAAMRRRAGLARSGPYWFAQELPEEWVPLSARYPEFFPSTTAERLFAPTGGSFAYVSAYLNAPLVLLTPPSDSPFRTLVYAETPKETK